MKLKLKVTDILKPKDLRGLKPELIVDVVDHTLSLSTDSLDIMIDSKSLIATGIVDDELKTLVKRIYSVFVTDMIASSKADDLMVNITRRKSEDPKTIIKYGHLTEDVWTDEIKEILSKIEDLTYQKVRKVSVTGEWNETIPMSKTLISCRIVLDTGYASLTLNHNLSSYISNGRSDCYVSDNVLQVRGLGELIKQLIESVKDITL